MREHIEALRTLVESPVTGELPHLIKWLCARIREDVGARAKLIHSVEGYMESLIERLTDVPTSAYTPPPKKGRGKKAVEAPTPPPVPSKAERELHELTAEEVVSRVLERISSDKYEPIAERVANFDADKLEEYVVSTLNKYHHTNIGPWSFWFREGAAGFMKIHAKFAGSEQDEDTEVPIDDEIDTDGIEKGLKHTLGASAAYFNWKLAHTPRSWGYAGVDKYIVAFEGHAEWRYDEGAAVLFTLGTKMLRELAEKELETARKNAE